MGYLTASQSFDPRDSEVYDDCEEETYVTKKKKEYYSDVVGDYIVDAITNAKYPWRVGTYDEKRFFKITNTVRNVNAERKGTYDNSEGRISHTAFYETPHAYMKHCGATLDEDYVKSWYNRVNNDFPNIVASST